MLTLLFGISQSFFCAFYCGSIICIFFTRANHPPALEALDLRGEPFNDGGQVEVIGKRQLTALAPRQLRASVARPQQGLLYCHETENLRDRGSIKIFWSWI